MINLLPPELKTSYHFARRNVSLRKWLIACLIALIGLGGLTTFGLLTLKQSSVQYKRENAMAAQILEDENFKETQARVKEISNSFKLVVTVLKQQVLFSELLEQIATTIPANANLTGLNITQTQGGIDITAAATDYKTATQFQVNLNDPANEIFTKADIVSVGCGSSISSESSGGGSTEADNRYPCRVTVRALFAADNRFLFINSQGSKKAVKP